MNLDRSNRFSFTVSVLSGSSHSGILDPKGIGNDAVECRPLPNVALIEFGFEVQS